MSRTNNTTRYDHWNIKKARSWSWDPDEWYRVGTELYDLRFYAGCKRQPQLVHREIVTYGWASKITLRPRIAARCARKRRNGVRTAEREYNDVARKLWNGGEDVDDLLEPADSRHGAILWDIW